MSYTLESLRYKPSGFWQLDDDSPFTDYSGYNRSGSASAQPGRGLSVASGTQFSSIFSNSCIATFESPVFKQSNESQGFTLVANVRLIEGAPGEQQVLGNTGNYDGIIVNGTKIYFVTKYVNTGEARAEYELQVPRTVNVFGVHTSDKNSLYVDGELVAEVSISEDQKNDTYLTTDNNLYAGQSSTTNSIEINSVGIYPLALDGNAISELSQSSLSFNDDTPYQYDGRVINLNADSTIIFATKIWETALDWKSGMLWNTATEQDYLVPTFIGDTSQAGTWMDSFAMDSLTFNIYGVYLDWDGEGITVEASLDGNTWESATRGKKVDLIQEGFDPTNKSLQVRISFSGGVVSDQSYLETLKVVGLQTGTISHPNTRPVTITGGTPRLEKPAMEQSDMWGVNLNGGSLTIGADPSEIPVTPKTIEVWIKRNGDAPASWSGFTPTSTTFFSNGVSGSSYPRAQWTVRHFVNSTGFTGDFTISGDVTVGRVVLYSDAFTVQDISNVYKSYAGQSYNRIADNSVIGVAESSSSIDIYARDWAINVAG